MGRTKRTSKALEKAAARANGLKAVGAFDFGNGLNTAAFEQAVTDTRAKLDDYNQTLSLVDEKYNLLLTAEKSLQDLSERVLAGVAAKYGKNSNEYELAGGIRKSERKRPASRKKGGSILRRRGQERRVTLHAQVREPRCKLFTRP